MDIRNGVFCETPVSYTHLDVYKRQACSLKAIKFVTEMPEQSEEGYHVNLRKSLHYARMNFPIDDEGIQPPKEAVEAAGLKPTGSGVARSFWDDPDTEKEE